LHYVRDDVAFREAPDYIYGRYDLGDGVVHDRFFPRVYSAAGAPTDATEARLRGWRKNVQRHLDSGTGWTSVMAQARRANKK